MKMFRTYALILSLCSMLGFLAAGCGDSGGGGSSSLIPDSGERYIYTYAVSKSRGNSVTKIGIAHNLSEVTSQGGTVVTGALIQKVGSFGPTVSTGADGKFNLRSFGDTGSGDISARFIVTLNDGSKPFTFNDITVNLGQGYFGTLRYLQIVPAQLALNPGDTYTLFVYGYDENNYPLWIPSPVWSNSNAAVGTIDTMGIFKAAAVGSTVLTATYQNKSAQITVTVQGGGTGSTKVSGTVTTQVGDALPNGFAMVMPQNPQSFVPNGIAIADTTGTYQIAKLPQGVYYAYAFGYKNGTDYASAPLTLNVTGDLTRDFSCAPGTYIPPPIPELPPGLDALTPDRGSTGISVTLTGLRFGAAQGSSYISFNGTPAPDADSWSNSRIVCKVPACAQSGAVRVIVKNQASNEQTYTVVQPQWTFLVYLDGTNNLESYGDLNMGQMAQVGSSQHLNIIVQFSRASENGKARRYYVAPGYAQEIADLGVTDMADPANLKNFITWGMGNYPADHYVLDLWDHGNGWKHKGIISDDISHKILTMQELSTALNGVPRLDILSCDACLMQMAEVAYQLKDYADYLVASEETIPGQGYPYDTMLQVISANPDITPYDFAASMIPNYLNAYSSGVTLSAVRLDQIAALAAAVNSFADALYNNFSSYSSQIINSRSSSQDYSDTAYVDLYDFASRIASNGAIGEPVHSAALGVMSAVNSAVFANGYKGSYMAGSHGVAVFFPAYGPPWNDFDGHSYSGLNFIGSSAAPRWYDFLLRYNQ